MGRKRREKLGVKKNDALLRTYVHEEFINPETGEIQMPGVWSRIATKLNNNRTGSVSRNHKACRAKVFGSPPSWEKTGLCYRQGKIHLLLAVESINAREDRDIFGPPPRGTWPLLAFCFEGRSHSDLKNAFHSFRRQRRYTDQGIVYRSRMLLRLSETLEDPWGTDFQILNDVQQKIVRHQGINGSEGEEKKRSQ